METNIGNRTENMASEKNSSHSVVMFGGYVLSCGASGIAAITSATAVTRLQTADRKVTVVRSEAKLTLDSNKVCNQEPREQRIKSQC